MAIVDTPILFYECQIYHWMKQQVLENFLLLISETVDAHTNVYTPIEQVL